MNNTALFKYSCGHEYRKQRIDTGTTDPSREVCEGYCCHPGDVIRKKGLCFFCSCLQYCKKSGYEFPPWAKTKEDFEIQMIDAAETFGISFDVGKFPDFVYNISDKVNYRLAIILNKLVEKHKETEERLRIGITNIEVY